MPSTIGGLFYVLILIAVLAGLLLASIVDWRLGVRVCAAALSAAALLRLVLPEKDAGMLVVRHRFLDVPLLLGIGLALFILVAAIPDQPV